MTGMSQAGWLARALWIETAVENALGCFVDGPIRDAHEWITRKHAAEQWEMLWESY